MFTLTLRCLIALGACGFASAATDLNREIILAPHAGSAPEDAAITRWQERAQRADVTAEVYERLAWAYIAKARTTLDAGFYKLAEKTADVLDAQFGARAETQLLRGHVLHQLHQFRAAETVARAIVAARGSPADFALLSDVLIEQGRLEEGVSALQRLVDAKPGVEAFSRIAHVRWLKGDSAGAIAAMSSALQASSERDSDTRAWLITRLSGYELQRGDASLALRLADAALECAGAYPPALLARGRALVALDRTGDAIASLQVAEQLQPLPEYQWWLADGLRALGRADEASSVEQRLRRRGAETDPRTLALFLATRGEEPERALRLARQELTERADVFSHDALAWTLAASGDLAAASVAMDRAIAVGTKDARLLLHAGELARRRGDVAAAGVAYAAARGTAGTLTPSEAALLARRLAPDDGLAAH